VTRDGTTYRADFQAANRPANFPVLYPTVRQDASTFVPWVTSPIRTYNIKEAGGGNNSLYAYWGYNGIAGSYWGIEETRFTNAPILANPDQRRRLDGRTYQFYFDGSLLQVRSASRLGRKDFGVNRGRVERLRALIQAPR